jgi:cytochrome c biogenesis protein CcmG, thiol:disulfide interchange protein DsbE
MPSSTTSSSPASPTPDSKPKVSGKVLAGILGVAVIALAGAAMLLTRTGGSDEQASVTGAQVAQETAAVAVTGPALTPHGEGPDPAIGTAAPKVVGQTFFGNEETIAPGATPMVLAFVAHWCPHCQNEVPKLADWARGGTRKGVAIRAISTATTPDRPNYPPSAWLVREGFDIPTLADDEKGSAAQAYGLTSFPYFVAIDASGKVAARVSGEIGEAQLDALIAAAKS